MPLTRSRLDYESEPESEICLGCGNQAFSLRAVDVGCDQFGDPVTTVPGVIS